MVDDVLAGGEDEAPADVLRHPPRLAQPGVREESGGQSLQSDVPPGELRQTLRTLSQVRPGPAVSAQVVALLALPDLAGGPQLLLAEAAEELSEDLVLQPGGAEVAAAAGRVREWLPGRDRLDSL